MVNGVMQIVAAVLFAVIALEKGTSVIWLCVAGVYLALGAANLIGYAIRTKKKQKAAAKQAELAAKS